MATPTRVFSVHALTGSIRAIRVAVPPGVTFKVSQAFMVGLTMPDGSIDSHPLSAVSLLRVVVPCS